MLLYIDEDGCARGLPIVGKVDADYVLSDNGALFTIKCTLARFGMIDILQTTPRGESPIPILAITA